MSSPSFTADYSSMLPTSLPPSDADVEPPYQPHHAANDAQIVALYAPDKADVVGLLAYALHRRALLEWVDVFFAATHAPPDAAALAQFYMGETMQGRIAAYRAQAEQLLRERPSECASSVSQSLAVSPAPQSSASAKPNPRGFLTWGLEEAISHAKEPIPWRALAMRLLLLLLAVVVTALVLRFLFVPRAYSL